MGVLEWRASVCPTTASSHLLKTCPWFWPCITSQPETEADCPAWPESLPDLCTYAKGFRHIEPTLAGNICYQSQETLRAGHISQKILKIMDTMIWLSKSVKQSEYRLHNISYLVRHEIFIFFVFSFQRVKYILDVFVHVYLGYYIVEDLIYILMIHEWPQS